MAYAEFQPGLAQQAESSTPYRNALRSGCPYCCLLRLVVAKMAQRYRRVPVGELGEEEEAKKQRAERIDYITAKIHAVFWVGAAVAIVYFTDLVNVALHDDRVNRLSLNLSILCLATNLGIILYATLWLPLVLRVRVSIDIYSPKIIPIATGLGVLCVLLLMVAFWPIFGLLTPLLVFFLLFGFLFSAHFVPCPSL